MSTRSQVQYMDNHNPEEVVATLYHHWDGYPSSRLPNIKEALDLAIKHYKQSNGYEYRVKDLYTEDLAAFYVLAHKDGPGNVEIDSRLHGDIEYLYQVSARNGKLHVKILVPANWKKFWDHPSLDNMKLEAEGDLDDLVKKYENE